MVMHLFIFCFKFIIGRKPLCCVVFCILKKISKKFEKMLDKCIAVCYNKYRCQGENNFRDRNLICGSAGIGRQARLRGVCL